ncbi:MAG: ribosome maturation factor RimP [Synergistaceae bacterium]|nr:ribosome maturation factor RimP [Synergistaceae bacterium]
MSDRDLKKLKETLRGIVESGGLECHWIDVFASRPASAKILRVYIDKEGGVGHADCEMASMLVNDYLDSLEAEGRPWLDGKYFVEVSSPGIERQLFTLEHYRRSIGGRVLFFTKNRKKYEGTLISCDGGDVTLETGEGATHAVPFSDIKKGNMVYVPQKGEKKGGCQGQKDAGPRGKN